MAVQLNQEIIELLTDKETVKVLATTDVNGVPHVVIKQTLQLGEDGNLVYLELLEFLELIRTWCAVSGLTGR